MPVTDMEAVFHEQLKGFVFSSEEVAQVLQDADQAISAKQELLSTLEGEKKRVEAEMRKVYQAYISDKLSMHAYGQQYRPLDERFQQLEEEIPLLQGEIDFLKIQHLASEEVLSEARNLYTRWPDLSFEEKRQIVETIVDGIEIGDGEVAIELLYLSPSLSEMAKGHRNNTGSAPFCHQAVENLQRHYTSPVLLPRLSGIGSV